MSNIDPWYKIEPAKHSYNWIISLGETPLAIGEEQDIKALAHALNKQRANYDSLSEQYRKLQIEHGITITLGDSAFQNVSRLKQRLAELKLASNELKRNIEHLTAESSRLKEELDISRLQMVRYGVPMPSLDVMDYNRKIDPPKVNIVQNHD